jgi:hypothetical protein
MADIEWKPLPAGLWTPPAVFVELGNLLLQAFTDDGVPTWEISKKRGKRGEWLKIPLISDEAINIGKSRLFEEELTELFHERPQAILPHGRDELIMQAALAEQRMDTSLGCAGL